MQRILQEIVKKIILGTSDTGQWEDCPIDPATQRIILKIVGFLVNVESNGRFYQIFVAFSENLNFIEAAILYMYISMYVCINV